MMSGPARISCVGKLLSLLPFVFQPSESRVCCIGAGKTFTLGSLQPEHIGMMPRAAAAIFMGVDSDPTHHYTVHMSYLQIYNELLQVPRHDRTCVASNIARELFGMLMHQGCKQCLCVSNSEVSEYSHTLDREGTACSCVW